MKRVDSKTILSQLDEMYPDAECELIFRSVFELLIAVTLSAQTTDKSVNKVTPNLFKRYPDAKALSEATYEVVENIIKPLGLYRNKAKNIIMMAKKLNDDYGGCVPDTRNELESLPGVGRKTANVVLAVGFHQPALAVDTHVARVAIRLGYAKANDNPLQIEKKLMRAFPKESWAKAHHQLLFFGRYTCKSKNPNCTECPFAKQCFYKG